MTTFCKNMNISHMLNLEYRTPNTDFRSKEEGRINPLVQFHHSLFVNRHSIFSPIVIIQCAPPFFGGVGSRYDQVDAERFYYHTMCAPYSVGARGR